MAAVQRAPLLRRQRHLLFPSRYLLLPSLPPVLEAPHLAAFAHSARTIVRELTLTLIPQLACLFPSLEQKPDPLHRPPLRWRALLLAHLILRQACLILEPRLVHRAMMMRVPIVPARPARTGVGLLAVIAQCTNVVIDALRL